MRYLARNISIKKLSFLSVLFVTSTIVTAQDNSAADRKFVVGLDQAYSQQPVSGRLFIMISERNPQPKNGPNWFSPEPFAGMDVKDWKPGSSVTVNNKAIAFPVPINQWPAGTYNVQAVLDRNQGGRDFSNSPGNGFSQTIQVTIPPSGVFSAMLVIKETVPEIQFKESDRVKEIVMKSKLLSDFHGRKMVMKAGVVFPPSYQQDANRTYPIMYEIPGFGGRHYHAASKASKTVRRISENQSEELIHVVLDPDCSLGHHVFADSANNGPYGEALIKEFIPYIESKLRVSTNPRIRFVSGHSSGGWSSLWLQTTYPEHFDGLWSTAPDPVDFRDFQQINLYKRGENMFVDSQQKPWPIIRMRGNVIMNYKVFSDLEIPMGHGGQLGSFEAVFSPKGEDGMPMKLWNRQTGEIDFNVAQTWEKYDIRLQLEKNWDSIKDKLTGKMNVYMGTEDTFYLDGATQKLKESLEKLGSDAKVHMVPGRDHGNLLRGDIGQQIDREIGLKIQELRSR